MLGYDWFQAVHPLIRCLTTTMKNQRNKIELWLIGSVACGLLEQESKVINGFGLGYETQPLSSSN